MAFSASSQVCMVLLFGSRLGGRSDVSEMYSLTSTSDVSGAIGSDSGKGVGDGDDDVDKDEDEAGVDALEIEDDDGCKRPEVETLDDVELGLTCELSLCPCCILFSTRGLLFTKAAG